ncbi:chemotaxis protein CheA [Curvibacter sp. HBC61]|uniref:histidine kinase n=1 Tax=Curvibacter cyanobacteriorum TaxID=3026422 RepID=A0ABT5N0E8_9BURK|nr:chemotaxis protein CheA [Curvibacter sp. HBC61]MDD0839794.1 chemotaxis protein CheA [Curvibacter sp. HBC61]
MNPLLEQFLSEARDTLEAIGVQLMELENAPDDTELMTQLFRLVHTLKGNSGLFEVPEMTRVLHAGEDLMDAVRHQEIAFSDALADRLLDAMDYVARLCDDMEAERPCQADTVSEAQRLVDALRALMPQRPSEEEAVADAPTQAPLAAPRAEQLLALPEALRMGVWRAAQSPAPGLQLLWGEYQPDEQCFFQGEDPLYLVRQLPGLVWAEVQSRQPWPELASLDAYQCQLAFHWLALSDVDTVASHFRYVPDQVRWRALPPLCLALPQGDPNGGPVYEDFVTDALNLLNAGDTASLARAVRSMLELSNGQLWLSSALRWLQLLLDSPDTPPAALRQLVLSLRQLQVPDWAVDTPTPRPPANLAEAEADASDAAASTPPDAAPATAVAPVDDSPEAQAFRDLLAVQREVLAMPDDAQWLAGRIKAASGALAACLRANQREDELPQLAAVTAEALASGRAAPLAEWLDLAFAGAQGELIRPAAPPADETAPATGTEPATAATSGTVGNAVTAATAAPLPAPAALAPAAQAATAAGPDTEARADRRTDDHVSAKSLKVDQVKIDRLMNLIGEMVVAKNAIPYLANRAETLYGMRELSREIKAQYAVINRISEEMQDAIMQVRMMPVSFVFQRFPRLVRDLSRRLGKEVHLVLEGEDTAADKNIIESISDPLVHMVRNSLDHGLETPEQRLAAGKPAQGQLRIAARQEADRVVIEISDDGAGIDPEVIKFKAYEKGLIDEATLERITPQEAINLVFLPGFSTAEAVSDLSGRGVGMDVVRTAIERVNGSLALDSVKGRGTTVRLSLPLSMAVTHVMTIETDGQTFGIPIDMVMETVRVPRSAVRGIKDNLVTVLRGRVVPLKSLNRLLGLSAPPLCNDNDELAVLVVRIGDEVLGLLVDAFKESTDIILKPLAGVLGGLSLYSGSALLGDGSVLMVLNVKEMV